MVVNAAYLEEVRSIDAPGEIEALLPWHANGALSAQDRRRVMRALAADPALARIYAKICHERAEVSDLEVDLGRFADRARDKLFAAIDAEPRDGWNNGRSRLRLSAVSCTDEALHRLAVIA